MCVCVCLHTCMCAAPACLWKKGSYAGFKKYVSFSISYSHLSLQAEMVMCVCLSVIPMISPFSSSFYLLVEMDLYLFPYKIPVVFS